MLPAINLIISIIHREGSHHSESTGKFAQEVVFVKLGAALVLIKHGELELLHLLEVIVHLEFHPKHRVQVVHSSLRPTKLPKARRRQTYEQIQSIEDRIKHDRTLVKSNREQKGFG